jgi:glutaredoxin 3
MNIFVYTKKGCPNCVTAKQMLKARNLKFIECDMEIAGVRDSFFAVYPDAKQMPQIFINDQRIGGLAGLCEAFKQMNI